MEKINFVKLKKCNYFNGLSAKEIRIKLSGKDPHISFNQKITKEIKERKFTHDNFGVGEHSNQLYLVFNYNEGYPIPNPDKYKVYVIRGRNVINFLKEHFNLTGDSCVLAISENLAKTQDYSTYKISLPTETQIIIDD
jgi:hypothetical protein